MAIVITNQANTIKFDVGNSEEYHLDKDNLSIKKKFGFISIHGKAEDVSKFTKLKFRFSEVSSPVSTSNTELIAILLGYKVNVGITVGDVRVTDGVEVLGVNADSSVNSRLVDSNGDDAKFSDSKLRVSAIPYPFDIAEGNLPDHFTVNKFGQNEDIGTGAFEDIWDGGGVYPYPADGAAPITHIYSTVAGDTQDVEVQGLDITGLLTIQTITLTGTTVAPLTTALWRVFRLKNEGVTNNAGIIHATDSLKAVSYAQIAAGNNQTLMALWTVPLGMTAYLLTLDVSLVGLTSAYNIDGHMSFRKFGKVFQLKRTFGLSSTGTSAHNKVYQIPIGIDALTDIKISAISSKAGGVMNASFAIIYETV